MTKYKLFWMKTISYLVDVYQQTVINYEDYENGIAMSEGYRTAVMDLINKYSEKYPRNKFLQEMEKAVAEFKAKLPAR